MSRIEANISRPPGPMPGKVTDLTDVKTIVDSVDCRCGAVIALST